MKEQMKKVGVLLGIGILGLGLFACGNNEQTEEKQSSTEEVVIETSVDDIAKEVESSFVEETTVEETDVEEEKIPVDERYEYKLYYDNDITPENEDNGTVAPVIGLNIPNGWEEAGSGIVTSGFTGVEYQKSLRMMADNGGYIDIYADERMYEVTFEENKFDLIAEIVEKNREGSVDTPFGMADIYSVKYDMGTGAQYDAQVVLITIGSRNIVINDGSATVNFEELLPQMFNLE